jgi:hypothetical protein
LEFQTKYSSEENEFIRRKLLKNKSELVYVMRYIFDASRKVIKNFNFEIKGTLFGKLISLQLQYVSQN